MELNHLNINLNLQMKSLSENLNLQMKSLSENLTAQLNTFNAQLSTLTETQAARLDRFENKFLFRMLFAVSFLRIYVIPLSNNHKGFRPGCHRN
jgi:hypothetical protein